MVAAFACVVAARAEPVLTPEQEAITDSLQVLHDNIGPDAVAALVSEHLPDARAAGDSLFIMRLVGARGASYTHHRRADAGIDDLQEAVAIGTALGDSMTVGRNLLWLTRACEVTGRHAQSYAIRRRLTILGRGIGSPYYEARGLVGEAWQQFVVGDYVVAESLYTVAIDRAMAAQDTFTALWSDNGRGLCYWNLSRLAEADTTFARVRSAGRRMGLDMIEAVAVNNHAGLLEVLGRPDEALEGYRQSRAMNLAQGNHREAFPAGLNIARCQQQLGRYDEAETTLEGLIEECREFGFTDLLPVVMENLGLIQIDRGRYMQAVRTCREALAVAEELVPRYEIQLRLAMASALAQVDSLDAALAEAEHAAAIVSADQDIYMRAEVARALGSVRLLRDEPLLAAETLVAAAVDLESTDLVNQRLALESRAGEAWMLAGRPDDARYWLERSLRLWEDTRTLPEDAIWRERRSGAARRLFEALAELTLVHPDTVPAGERAARCFDLLQHFKARTLLERTLGPGRDLADPRPVALAELQAQTLRPGEVFLDTYMGDRHGLVFAVTCDTLMVQPLRGRDQVSAAVDVLRGQLGVPGHDVSWPLIEELAGAVVGHVDGILPTGDLASLLAGASTVTWSPDGPLHQVPLAPLVDTDRLFIVRTPSATFLANLRRRSMPDIAAPARVLALAGDTDGNGRPLTGAVREVAWIADEFEGVTAIRDTAADTPFGAHDPAEFDLLHFAAHAELDNQRPWNSALVFGPPHRPQRLAAGVVADLDLRARIAVLTSCNSAGGTVLTGEGMLGLASGFLSAGVPAVVATLWPVDDNLAEVFSHRFYGALADGHTAAEALHHTRAWLRDREATAHPFHWAGYVLVGEGDQVVPLEAREGLAPWIAAGGGLLTAVVTMAARRRRQRTSVNA